MKLPTPLMWAISGARWAVTAAAIVVVLLIVAAVSPALFGERTFIVTGGSMEPAIPIGSGVVTEKVHQAAIQEGDVITYVTRAENVVTHRVVERVNDEFGPGFRTKGDANTTADVELVRPVNLLGRVSYFVPFAGYLLHYSNQPLTRTGIIIVALALVGVQVVRGWPKAATQKAVAMPQPISPLPPVASSQEDTGPPMSASPEERA